MLFDFQLITRGWACRAEGTGCRHGQVWLPAQQFCSFWVPPERACGAISSMTVALSFVAPPAPLFCRAGVRAASTAWAYPGADLFKRHLRRPGVDCLRERVPVRGVVGPCLAARIRNVTARQAMGISGPGAGLLPVPSVTKTHHYSPKKPAVIIAAPSRPQTCPARLADQPQCSNPSPWSRRAPAPRPRPTSTSTRKKHRALTSTRSCAAREKPASTRPAIRAASARSSATRPCRARRVSVRVPLTAIRAQAANSLCSTRASRAMYLSSACRVASAREAHESRLRRA